MIAYNEEGLNNLLIREELESACNQQLISNDEKLAAEKLYPVGFYTPNIFIRIGLFILTAIIVSFSMGLVSLAFLDAMNEKSFAGITLFFGIAIYAALEVMVVQKKHYRSGVDDALLWICGACIIGSINLMANLSYTANCVLVLLIAVYFLLRFANALMGLLVVLSLLQLVFLTYTKMGNFAKATAPFLILAIAIAIYFIAKTLAANIAYKFYNSAFTLIKITALICAYASVNYFVVREAANAMFGLNLKDGQPIAFGWLFWITTIIIPCIYIARGLQKKDVVLLRVGLILVAAIVFTIRYYYTILPVEIIMTIAGVAMIALAYGLIKYLKVPKHGFTYEALNDNNVADKINIEALVIAETFSGAQAPESNTNFGGGSFGGGGATSDF